MAKKERTGGSNLGRPRKYVDSASNTGRSGIAINVRIDPVLREKIDKYRLKIREQIGFEVDLTQVVEKALRDLFLKELPDEPTKPAG